MSYELPVRRAIGKAEQHCSVVLKELRRRHPGVGLHEIPFRDIILATQEQLGQHPDFDIQSGPNLSLRRPLYAGYELGNTMLLHLLVYALQAKGALQKKHVELFKTSLGRLYYRPPLGEILRQKRAFEKLVKALGKKRCGRLLVEAYKVSQKHKDAYFDARRELGLAHKLSDYFGNPAHSRFLIVQAFELHQPFNEDTAVRYMRESLDYLERYTTENLSPYKVR